MLWYVFVHTTKKVFILHVQSLSWDPNHSKALIVIGDEVPHPARYTDQDIFWKDQIQKLADQGVIPTEARYTLATGDKEVMLGYLSAGCREGRRRSLDAS